MRHTASSNLKTAAARLSGYLLLLAGAVTFGAYAYLWQAHQHRADLLPLLREVLPTGAQGLDAASWPEPSIAIFWSTGLLFLVLGIYVLERSAYMRALPERRPQIDA